jgi:hypothetical protein
MHTEPNAAGAPDDEARAAAEEVGDLHAQFGGLRTAMHDLRTDLKDGLHALRLDIRNELTGMRSEVAYLRGRFDVLIWAVGINAAATIAILGVLLRH